MPPIYVLLALLALLYYISKRLGHGLPPGPLALPFLGNTHQFLFAALKGKSNVDLMGEWKEQYGNVYTIWVGPLPVVLICDYQTTVDAFVKNGDAHAGRQDSFIISKTRDDYMGIIFNEGPEWQEQRRFTLRTLRNFGFGRNIMQQKILEEAEFHFERLDRKINAGKDGKVTMDPAPFFDLLVGSIINKLLAGYRYDESNVEEFLALKHNLDTAFEKFTALDLILFNKFTYKLPLFKQRWNVISQPTIDIRQLMERQIKNRQAAVESGQHVLDLQSEGDDYIDAFLIEMEKRKEAGQDMESYNVNTLASNLLDLWVAGMETTISTLLWTFIFLLNHPKVEEKARKEILCVTGGNRNVELSDKNLLPYVNDVVTEALRCGNVLNINLFHRTTTDAVVGDYIIPKNTILTSQQSVIMTNEKEFIDAQRFNPDRYSADKNTEKRVIPFGLGKRSCLGESLARVELFLLISNFVQRYKISVPEGRRPPTMQQLLLNGFFKRVHPYEMTIEKVSSRTA